MSELKSQFIQHLKNNFPGLAQEPLEELISENLLSPFKIQIPRKYLEQAQDAIKAIYKLREDKNYQNNFSKEISMRGFNDPGNKAIMMSYDFHVGEDGNLKLIEINTNAAFLTLGDILYSVRNIPKPVPEFSVETLKRCILDELKLFGLSVDKPSIVITDDRPETQRLYIEFLVCRELFKSWGWNCEIRDVTTATQNPKPDFIYNRYTDFYLSDPASARLLSAYVDKEICFSPHPIEYLLLADKNRMTEWSLSPQDPAIEKVLLKSWALEESNKEEMWANRKTLFFKPSQDFGSKGSFKGSSISRKVFEELVAKQYSLAQEYAPAPEITFETDTGPQNFKYDLRFYTYQDQLQTVMARIYQGQTTNLRTPNGGFACVEFQ
jgi:hypothetical protein